MKRYLITFKNDYNKELLSEFNAKDVTTYEYINNVITCLLDDNSAEKLSEVDEIISVELDDVDNFDGLASSSYTNSYAWLWMGIDRFHAKGIKGDGVKVAVMDSGIQKHVDLEIKGGVNAYNGSLPYDSNLANGHGTRVAGVIASKGIKGNFVGGAPNVDLYAIRIDDGGGSINRTHWSSQIAGINWAIQNGMDVVNCSFSSENDSEARRQAFKAAADAGIAIFCSGGNRQGSKSLAEHTVVYPSCYPFVITTDNLSSNKSRYSTSSVGRGLNFANGGVSIRTTNIDATKSVSDKYSSNTGTSYASPASAGIYALYKQMYPNLDRDKILQKMYVNAENLGNPLYFGAGIPKFPKIEHENILINGRLP